MIIKVKVIIVCWIIERIYRDGIIGYLDGEDMGFDIIFYIYRVY